MIGTVVKYTDPHGVAHDALVTACFNGDNEPWTDYCVNIVYVVGDESKTDQYGRQIVRETSVSPRSEHSAHGRFYEPKVKFVK